MKNLAWIVASLGAGAALLAMWHRRDRQYQAIGDAAIGDAAKATFGWGTKQRVAGSAERVTGKIKEGLNRIAGKDDLAGEGVMEETVGAARDAAGTVAQGAGETIHDLNC